MDLAAGAGSEAVDEHGDSLAGPDLFDEEPHQLHVSVLAAALRRGVGHVPAHVAEISYSWPGCKSVNSHSTVLVPGPSAW